MHLDISFVNAFHRSAADLAANALTRLYEGFAGFREVPAMRMSASFASGATHSAQARAISFFCAAPLFAGETIPSHGMAITTRLARGTWFSKTSPAMERPSHPFAVMATRGGL